MLAGSGWRQAGRADLRLWVTDREPHGIGTYPGRPEFIWVDWSEDGPLRTIAFWNRCISSRRSLGHDGGKPRTLTAERDDTGRRIRVAAAMPCFHTAVEALHG